MDIQELDIHPRFKAELSKVLSGDGVAEGSFTALVEAGCDADHLAFLITQPRRPKQRVGSAEDRKCEKQELTAMAGSLSRLAKQMREVLARKRYDQQSLLGCEVRVWVPEFRRLTAGYPIQWWLERWAERVRGLADRPIPKLLLNSRDLQRLRLMEYVRAQTGRPHFARVADLLYAAETHVGSSADVTEAYLKKIDAAFRKNRRKWREAARKDESPSATC